MRVQFRPKRSVHAAKRHPGRLFADLYEGNAGFNAHEYRKAGRPFVVLKATQGTGHVDALHATRCEASHLVGLPVGHYHYLNSSGDPAAEARHFWATVHPHFLGKWPRGRGHDSLSLSHTDFLILDVEAPGMRDAAQKTRQFEQQLHRLSGEPIICYASKSFLLENNLRVTGEKYWVADYPTFPGNIGKGRILWAHQFSDAFRLPGISHPGDASVLVSHNSIRYWDNGQVL